jgi:hypothetical protein
MVPMTDIERLAAVEEIKQLRSRRDRALDLKDWSIYEGLHVPEHHSHSDGFEPWTSAVVMTQKIRQILDGVTSIHHCHTPDITLTERDKAKGIWAMEDNLFWRQGDEEHWLHGFGFYYETYEKRSGGWFFASRRLKRLTVKMSAGAIFGPNGAGKA